jgi:cell wall assembly regulator SMI1
LPSIRDFATWEPVLELLRADNAERLADPGGHVAGRIDRRGGWSLPLRPRFPPGRALLVSDMQDEFDAVQRVQGALADGGIDSISFVAEIRPSGRTVLYLLSLGPAAEPGIGCVYPGCLILVEGSVPEPWRRRPEPVPGARPARSVNLALLERMLRERLPGAIGATEAEIAAAEARLGVALPAELKVLYRVTRARREDWGDSAAAEHVDEVVGCYLFALDELYIATASTRPCPWQFAATAAVITPPGAAVQGLVGSPGWIAFGHNGDGDQLAVDLTPGPRGHTGQIIMLNHEDKTGAELLHDSLTGLVMHKRRNRRRVPRQPQPPVVARVNWASLQSVQAVAHPGLEVLSIGVWEGEPFSLAPVTGLPRLRTLTAYPGTLASPLEIAKLTGLEFLELAPEEWRVLLDAGAVPRSLLAAAIDVPGNQHPLPIMAISNELLALWDRPPITQTVLEGHLRHLA